MENINALVSSITFIFCESVQWHWARTSPNQHPALCTRESEASFKPPFLWSWVLHSFQSTSLIWSHFILTTTRVILTTPNEESRELYLHRNYHVAQNGCPPLGSKRILSTVFSSVFFFFFKPDHGAHFDLLKSTLHQSAGVDSGRFGWKLWSTPAMCPKLQTGNK